MSWPLAMIVALCLTGSHSDAQKSGRNDGNIIPKKYVGEFSMYEPAAVRDFNLVVYYDYDEALIASRKLKKPVMLDFSGINCANCRKMESQVWSRQAVARVLKNDFILVTLYCDASKVKLPKEQQYYSKELGQIVTTAGERNQDIQASKFGSNGMPLYFFVDGNGKKLFDKGYSYDPSEQKFLAHLKTVKEAYRKDVR